MKTQVSILTIAMLCLGMTNDVYAQRSRNKQSRFVSNKYKKISSASDYENSVGGNVSGSSENRATVSDAKDCSAGTYYNADSSKCLACPTGQWSTSGSSTCSSCGLNVLACNSTTGEVVSCITGYKLESGSCVADSSAPETDEIKNIKQKFALQLVEVSSSCAGIVGDLKELEALTGTSTVSGGVAGLAGAGALTTGLLKGKDGDGDDSSKVRSGLGITETATLATGTIASGVATTTSAFGISKSDALVKKVKECNSRIADLEIIKNALVAEIEDAEKDPAVDKTVIQADKVLSACKDKFDLGVAQGTKSRAIATTATSGAGTLAGLTGTTLAVIDTVKNSEKTGSKNAKIVMEGIVIGTGAGTSVVGGISWAKLADMKKDAQACADVLNNNLVDVEYETKIKDIPYAGEGSTDTADATYTTTDTTDTTTAE